MTYSIEDANLRAKEDINEEPLIIKENKIFISSLLTYH
jgi:hypothetical protein